MGKEGPGHWGNPGHPPLTSRRPPRETLSFVAISEARKKKGLIFYKGSSQDEEYQDMGSPALNGKTNTTAIFAKSSLLGCREWSPILGCWAGAEPLAGSWGLVGCSLQLCELLAATPHWSMDTEGLPHSAINILFTTLSGFSRHMKTVWYFMVGKNQRFSKSNVSQTQAFGSCFHICCVCISPRLIYLVFYFKSTPIL